MLHGIMNELGNCLGSKDDISEQNTIIHMLPINRPLAGYGLPPPPPRGNFVYHIFLEAKYLSRILQHVCPLSIATLRCNSLLHTLPYKIFDD